MWIVVIWSLACLVAINHWVCRDLRYPPFIMSTLWLAVLSFYYAAPYTSHTVGPVTAAIFVVTVTSFALGGWLALQWSGGWVHGRSILAHRDQPSVRPQIRKWLLIASVLLFPLLLLKAQRLADLSGVDNFLMGLRMELLAQGSSGFGLIGNVTVLSFFTTCLYAAECDAGAAERFQYLLSLVLSLTCAALTTGRLAIYFILIAILSISWMRGRLSIRKVIGGAVTFLVAFGILSVALSKGGDVDASMQDNVAVIGESLVPYISGSLPAFDRLVRTDAPMTYGRNTFGDVINFVYRVTGQQQLMLIPEDVYVPYPTNVYTAFRPLYLDFGIGGLAAGYMLLGALSTYIFCRAVNGDRLFILYYGFALIPLSLVSVGDQYFVPFLTWVKFGALGYLYFRTGRAVVCGMVSAPSKGF